MARNRLADAASSLTLRGRCLVAGGLTLVLLGALLGERSLVQLALFVLALPLLSAVGVARQRFRLATRRSVTPARVPRGADAEVLLEVTNTDRRTGGLWLLTEHLSAELGDGRRGVLVDATCPGHCRTDMGGEAAPRTAEQGADTAVWLAGRSDGPTGRLWEDRAVVPW